jgi:hypothetical protein
MVTNCVNFLKNSVNIGQLKLLVGNVSTSFLSETCLTAKSAQFSGLQVPELRKKLYCHFRRLMYSSSTLGQSVFTLLCCVQL